MTDLEERVERAARAFDPESWRIFHEPSTCFTCDVNRKALRQSARAALEAALPELFADPPSAWLAPWEASRAMVETPRHLFVTTETAWRGLRDAHLHSNGSGE